MPSKNALRKAAVSLKKIAETQGREAAMAALHTRGGQLSDVQRQQAIQIINQAAEGAKGNKSPLAKGYQTGGVVLPNLKRLEEEEERNLRRQQLRQGRAPQQQQGPLGQVGDQIKGKLLGKAASAITDKLVGFPVFSVLFGQNGGSVGNPIENLLQLVSSGQMSPEQLIVELQKMGMSEQEAMQMVQQIMGSMGPSQNRAPLAAQPAMPMADGGAVDAMMIPSSSPIQKVKKKSVKKQGHGEQVDEMEISFDTKAMSELPMPPMSDMAKKVFGS